MIPDDPYIINVPRKESVKKERILINPVQRKIDKIATKEIDPEVKISPIDFNVDLSTKKTNFSFTPDLPYTLDKPSLKPVIPKEPIGRYITADYYKIGKEKSEGVVRLSQNRHDEITFKKYGVTNRTGDLIDYLSTTNDPNVILEVHRLSPTELQYAVEKPTDRGTTIQKVKVPLAKVSETIKNNPNIKKAYFAGCNDLDTKVIADNPKVVVPVKQGREKPVIVDKSGVFFTPSGIIAYQDIIGNNPLTKDYWVHNYPKNKIRTDVKNYRFEGKSLDSLLSTIKKMP